MAYQIRGLDPAPFRHLFGLSDGALAERGALRCQVTGNPGFPCRVTLDDGAVGETMILLNHVSHEPANPYRASHAIFVTEGEAPPACYQDQIPPALDRRVLSLRAFDGQGMMVDAALTQPGEADGGIRRLFERADVAYIHAHNAVRGCFAAKVERWT